MDKEERDALIEELASAWRPSPEGEPSAHPAWEKLDAQGRMEAFEIAKSLRLMEAAFDSEGLSTTGKLVMGRVAREQRAADTESARGAKLLSFPKRLMQSQPLAMAAVAMLVVGIGVWAGRDGKLESAGPTDVESVAVVDGATRELPVPAPPVPVERRERGGEPAVVAAAEAPIPKKAAAVERGTRRRRPIEKPTHKQRAETAESPDEAAALATAEPVESAPERPELDAVAKRSPGDNGTAKAISGTEQDQAATEHERKICAARVSVLEKMLRANPSYEPGAEEKLAVGQCYEVLGNTTKAKEWLKRAAKEPETKARAEKALERLRSESPP